MRGFCLPPGGVASGRVCDRSLRSRLVFIVLTMAPANRRVIVIAPLVIFCKSVLQITLLLKWPVFNLAQSNKQKKCPYADY